ncbi:MAG: hypothetical protein LBD29_04215 [Treponema sp.]|jgi:NTP pyrophosphatase (non-canonical NTP hydrolase)|nr:hypothetical protein [Treponema sp.]
MHILEEYRSALREAFDTWGKDSQVMMALEEMAELSKELLKNINRKKNNKKNITEELADVYVTLESLKIIYNISDIELCEIIDKKVLKLKNKLV